MTSMMTAFGTSIQASREADAGTLVEQQMITQMFAQVGANDLESFKAYLEENYEKIYEILNDKSDEDIYNYIVYPKKEEINVVYKYTLKPDGEITYVKGLLCSRRLHGVLSFIYIADRNYKSKNKNCKHYWDYRELYLKENPGEVIRHQLWLKELDVEKARKYFVLNEQEIEMMNNDIKRQSIAKNSKRIINYLRTVNADEEDILKMVDILAKYNVYDEGIE